MVDQTELDAVRYLYVLHQPGVKFGRSSATNLASKLYGSGVRGGGIDKAGVVKAVNIAWGFYAAQMILVPSKVHNDHFEEKSTKMTEFWARGHGVSIAVGIYALTQLDTDTAFKAAMAWVAGIGVAYPYNAKFNWFDTYKVKYPMHYVPCLLYTSPSPRDRG